MRANTGCTLCTCRYVLQYRTRVLLDCTLRLEYVRAHGTFVPARAHSTAFFAATFRALRRRRRWVGRRRPSTAILITGTMFAANVSRGIKQLISQPRNAFGPPPMDPLGGEPRSAGAGAEQRDQRSVARGAPDSVARVFPHRRPADFFSLRNPAGGTWVGLDYSHHPLRIAYVARPGAEAADKQKKSVQVWSCIGSVRE